jgi:hypothetical protein
MGSTAAKTHQFSTIHGGSSLNSTTPYACLTKLEVDPATAAK